MATQYYRFTATKNPMSAWGHAMFAADRESVCNAYGDNEHSYDGTGAVSINDIMSTIADQWDADKDDLGRWFDCSEADYYSQFDGATIAAMFSPTDIVNSADGFDSVLVVWLWDRVLDGKDIFAIETADGAVVFDSALICSK